MISLWSESSWAGCLSCMYARPPVSQGEHVTHVAEGHSASSEAASVSDVLQALSLLSEFQQTVHRPKSQYTGAAVRKKQQVGPMHAMQRGPWQPRRPQAC